MNIIDKTREILRDHPEALSHYNQVVEKYFVSDGQKAYISTTEAAQILGVSVPTIRKMAKEGKLFYIEVGKHIRFERKEIENYYRKLKERRSKGMDQLVELSEDMNLYD